MDAKREAVRAWERWDERPTHEASVRACIRACNTFADELGVSKTDLDAQIQACRRAGMTVAVAFDYVTARVNANRTPPSAAPEPPT